MTARFITATGTGIGKTLIACGLVRGLTAGGHAVTALKPIVSGFDPADVASSDPGRLLAAAGAAPTLAAVSQIAPYRFGAPLSPDQAARREERSIDFDALIGFCRRAIDRQLGVTLIEGIGGVMVPLDERHTVLDWIATLNIPVILVAGNYLGTLSHTLCAVDVLVRRNIAIAALVVSDAGGGTVSLPETVDTLKRFAAGINIIDLPPVSEADIAGRHVDRILR